MPLPQITSEQIVREAKELQEKDFKAPTQIITNEAELGEYRLRKRKEFEDTLRMKRWNLNIWMKVGLRPPLFRCLTLTIQPLGCAQEHLPAWSRLCVRLTHQQQVQLQTVVL